MDVTDLLGGKWLTHVDLPDDCVCWTVAPGCFRETFNPEGVKVCVRFQEHAKPLALNVTNLNEMVRFFGAETDEWTGQRVELFRSTTTMQGRTVPCIRLRLPGGGQTPPPQQHPPFEPQQHPPVESQDRPF